MVDKTQLSEREQEILRLVATGASNKMIAKQLSISTNTVKVHMRNVFAKIGAASRTEAAMYAVREGLAESLPGGPLAEAAALPVALARPWWKSAWLWLGVGLALTVFAGAGVRQWLRPALVPTAAVPAAIATPTPTPSRWQARAPMLTARSRLATAAYENQIYAIGGETAAGVTGALERYDPRTDSWRSLASKPLPVTDVGAAIIGGKIYVPGGRTITGRITDILELYDPRLDIWAEGPRLPHPLSAYALVAFEGKLLVFGGWDGTQFVASVYVFDPDTAKWEARTAMPTARGLAGATLAEGRVFVIGGTGSNGPLSTNEEYVPARELTGQSPWIVRGPMPEPRYGMGVASIADQVFMPAAQGTLGAMPRLLVYSPSRDGWEEVPGPNEPLPMDSALSAIGPMLYCFGGQTVAGREPHVWRYQVIFTVVIPLVQ